MIGFKSSLGAMKVVYADVRPHKEGKACTLIEASNSNGSNFLLETHMGQ